MQRLTLVLFAVLGASLAAASLPAQQWGDLSATFVYDGQLPKEVPLQITKDVEFCGKFHVIDESLVVNAENRGIPHVFAYLYLGRTDEPPKPHVSYEATAKASVKLDNNCCRFDPHVLTLRTTQTLLLTNSDDIGHNCKIDTLVNPPINYTIPAKGKLEHKFLLAERLPARVSCSIHPWMSAWLLIRDNPYMAVSDAKGKLTIEVDDDTPIASEVKDGTTDDEKKGVYADQSNPGPEDGTDVAGAPGTVKGKNLFSIGAEANPDDGSVGGRAAITFSNFDWRSPPRSWRSGPGARDRIYRDGKRTGAI